MLQNLRLFRRLCWLLALVTGLSLSGCGIWPMLPRCPVQGCHVRLTHKHNGQLYRGVPWWRRNKNPKVGQELKPGARYPGTKEYAAEKKRRAKPEKIKRSKPSRSKGGSEAPSGGGNGENKTEGGGGGDF